LITSGFYLFSLLNTPTHLTITFVLATHAFSVERQRFKFP